jgi:hypothetical protein
LINKNDSVLAFSSRSNGQGNFLIEKIKAGDYTVLVTFPGMADFILDVNLKDTGAVDIGKIVMTSRFHLLQEVIVQSGKAIRMKGDTLEFRADSFPVGQGANVEELLRRLPGLEVGADGKIIAQGEKVTKILVDGDEFFNDDPGLAQKYLQAKSVDKIQVFDKKSDQAIFSGIDDGVRTKTINIKLKENSKKGMFGKVSLGNDGNSAYSDEAMLNVFRNKEKISSFVFGANTGATGLSGQDRSQYFSGSDGIEDESGQVIGYDNDNYFYGSGQPTAFNTGAQYNNKWNQGRQGLNATYRLNRVTTQGWQTNSSTQLLPDSSIRKSNSNSSNSSYNFSHRASGSFDVVLDSFSTMKISAVGQTGNNHSASESYSESKNGEGQFLNKSTQQNFTNGVSGLFSSSVLWQHRFRKKGRNISIGLSQGYSKNESTRNTEALSYYYTVANPSPAGDSLNQQQRNRNTTSTIGAKISYTEPIIQGVSLNLEYGWKKTDRDKDRSVMRPGAGGKYDVPIDSLGNNYTYNVITHTPGMTLQYSGKKLSVTTGGRVSYTSLEQINRDKNIGSTRNYVNVFPQGIVSFRFSNTRRISLNYNGRTQQPSIEQLQPLKENSNPLYVTIGNPDLQPSFSHNVSLSYSSYSITGATSYNGNLNFSQTMNGIVSAQTVDQYNKTTSQYINRNGLPSVNGYFSFSRRLTKSASKSSVNVGLSMSANSYGYMRVLNGESIKTRSKSLYFGANLSFYKNKTATLNYNFSMNISESHSDNQNISASYNHSSYHNVSATVFLPWKIELSSNASMDFQPANSSFSTSRDIIKWNASMTKRFLKNGQGMVKLSVYDLLNQNTGYDRSASAGSISERTSSYIPRYGLLTLAWDFTKTF